MKPRLMLLTWMLLFVVASYGLLRVKYQVLSLQREIASTMRDLEQERENLHVAAAEWAYLTRPQRLEHLSAKYLRLQPMQPTQVAGLDSLDGRLSVGHAEHKVAGVTPASVHLPSGEE